MSMRRNSRQSAGRRAPARRYTPYSLYRRALRCEPLEDRRLLAVVTVNTLSDTVDFNDGVTSLREAIFATNTVPGADVIEFAPALTASGPATILLSLGELKITDSLTINGPGAELLTVDAIGNDPTPTSNSGDGTVVFNLDDGTTTLQTIVIRGLDITGGHSIAGIVSRETFSLFDSTVHANRGFGILHDVGTLQVSRSVIRDNETGIRTNSTAFVDHSTISQSKSGGGIVTTADLEVQFSIISGNRGGSGGGIYSRGTADKPHTLTIADSVVSNNEAIGEGGGIRKVFGDLLIVRSTVTGNTARSAGGGMSVADGYFNARIIDSTISNNSTSGSGGGGVFLVETDLEVVRSNITGNISSLSNGGGIKVTRQSALHVEASNVSENSARGDGGAIANESTFDGPAVTISNSTISANSATAGAAIHTILGKVLIEHTTITKNLAAHALGGSIYGGIRGAGPFYLFSSILAGNVNGDLGGSRAGNHSLGYNIIGTGPAASLADFNQPGDQVGVTDPLLGPLADNGGPTKTHALLPGSPAINAGDLSLVAGMNGVPQYDQRGEPFGRVFNGRIDIGAFEYQEPSDLNLVVDTLVDESDGNYAKGDLSLREAILLANTYAGPNYPNVSDTIRFDPTLTANGPATIVLSLGELAIQGATNIVGPGANLLTIDASGGDATPGVFDGKGTRIFNITDSASGVLIVSVSGLRLTGADGPGAISSSEDLRLVEVVLEQNGGELSVLQSTGKLTLDHSRIVNNTVRSSLNGGSAVNCTTLVMRESEISFNTGGGITAGLDNAGSILIVDSRIASNSRNGITVKASGGSFQLLRTEISDNSGSLGSGLGFNGFGQVLISDSTFARNISGPSTAQQGGGGAYIGASTEGSSVRIERSLFVDNRTTSSGGGLFVQGSVTIVDSEFRGNLAGQNGGGLLLGNAGQAIADYVVNGTVFADNVATNGAGAYIGVDHRRNATFSNNLFIGNSADSQGGGLAISAVSDGVATITGTSFLRNHSLLGGGASITTDGSARVRIENSTFAANSARQEGGGGATLISRGSSEISLVQTTVSGNTATGVGSGLSINANSGAVNVAHSTITLNGFSAASVFAVTGGPVRISNSIIAGNLSSDFRSTGNNLTLSHSLIGNSSSSGLTPAPIGSPDARGNLIGGTTAATSINPRLAPLADNGGPTQTHALLANSPAINNGDPAAAAGVNGVPFHDQRGAPFIRVFGGRIDMGAYELQPTDRVAGDFNGDGSVDTADYVVWRKTLGSTINLLADADGNGVVDEIDRAISLAHFGYVSPQQPIAAVAVVAEAETATSVSESSEKPSNNKELRTRLQNRQAVLDEAFAAITSRTISKLRRSRFAS